MQLENDLQVAYTDIDNKTNKLSPNEVKENEIMLHLFKNVAGKDGEVDWKELKEILDYYTRKEGQLKSMSLDNLKVIPEATNVATTNSPNSHNSVLTAILALLCGILCKDRLEESQQAPMQETALSQFQEMKDKEFAKDVCRSMIAMLDADHTGKLNFEEFKRLWNSIRNWKSVFKKFDKNHSGTLSGFELRESLTSAGYTLNNHTLNILMHRYGNKDGEVEFDDFIMCAVKLKIMIELFRKIAGANKKATFTFEEWIDSTLYS